MSSLTIVAIIFCCTISTQIKVSLANFNTYYTYLWGERNFRIDPPGNNVQLQFDRTSGAGFKSKQNYGSGLFHIRMKIPDKLTDGVVTTFYLTEAVADRNPNANHFEIDYEFVGTKGTVQTNVYNDDGGHREQTFKLWFNPAADFHTYEILWNPRQIQFRIDGIPIRVFKNHSPRGIKYPWRPMQVEGSIWNADWAGVVDWSKSPFIAYYQDFDFNGCTAQGPNIGGCGSEQFFWNKNGFWELNAAQQLQMRSYRKHYMIYDYCSKPSTSKPECALNA